MAESIVDLPRAGNALSLDFVNTVSARGKEEAREYLSTYGDLLTWARMEGVIKPAKAIGLLAIAEESPRKAARALGAARDLREAIHALVVAHSRGKKPAATSLEKFNAHLHRALAERRMTHVRGEFKTRFDPGSEALESPLWPIVVDTAELLVTQEAARLRECPVPDGGCGWVFLDTSKNNRRQWCRMEDCGNLAKARRFRARRRGED